MHFLTKQIEIQYIRGQIRGKMGAYVECELAGDHPNNDACAFESPPCPRSEAFAKTDVTN